MLAISDRSVQVLHEDAPGSLGVGAVSRAERRWQDARQLFERSSPSDAPARLIIRPCSSLPLGPSTCPLRHAGYGRCRLGRPRWISEDTNTLSSAPSLPRSPRTLPSANSAASRSVSRQVHSSTPPLTQSHLSCLSQPNPNAAKGAPLGPVGNFVATGSRDKIIRIWDTSNGVCIRSLVSPTLSSHRSLVHVPLDLTFPSSSPLSRPGTTTGSVRSSSIRTARCSCPRQTTRGSASGTSPPVGAQSRSRRTAIS